jgi:hypothetical protein
MMLTGSVRSTDHKIGAHVLQAIGEKLDVKNVLQRQYDDVGTAEDAGSVWGRPVRLRPCNLGRIPCCPGM